MATTLELTASELALIENARKQEILNQEAKALKELAQFEKDSRAAEVYIKNQQDSFQAQIQATTNYYNELVKLNPKYKLIINSTEDYKHIYDSRLIHDRKILKTIPYTKSIAHIILEDTPYKIYVAKHITTSRYRHSADNGYKMQLTGHAQSLYNARYLTNPKTVNKKIKDELEAIKYKKESEIKSLNSLEQAYKDMQALYPDANIVTGKEWLSNKYSKSRGEYINIMTIKLANGIVFKFRVYTDGSLSKLNLIFPAQNNLELISKLNSLTF